MLKSVAGLFLALATVALGQQHDHGAASGDTGPAPLIIGLGHLHHPITTSNPLAQRYFDQGLTLVYAFNHDEAARSFEYAAKLDPNCAMAYWGIALARGPNYNEWEIDAGREKIAAEAIKKAQALAGHGAARANRPTSRHGKARFRRSQGRSEKTGGELSRRDARSDEAVSRRSGCRGVIRRRRHGSARLEPLEARWQARRGNAGSRRERWNRC